MTLRIILEELVSGKYNHTDQRVKERKLIQAEQKIKELMLGEDEIEKILSKIEIPIYTDPMYVEETSNPAVIKLKSKYASIIVQAIHSAMLEKIES